MSNNIIDFLDFNNDDIDVLKIETINNTKIIHIKKKAYPCFSSKV